jgi:hypothetical protein
VIFYTIKLGFMIQEISQIILTRLIGKFFPFLLIPPEGGGHYPRLNDVVYGRAVSYQLKAE